MEFQNISFFLDFVEEGVESGKLRLKDLTDEDCTTEFVMQKFNVVLEWPSRYFKRFIKWYIRRTSLTKMQLYENAEDILHHLNNWDNGLKKALLKDKLIEKQRIKLKNEKRASRKATYKFVKEPVINPKTSTLEYVPVIESGEEQMLVNMSIPTNGKTITIPVNIKEFDNNDDKIYYLPLKSEEITEVFNSYLRKSPFFQTVFKHEEIVTIVNEYLKTAQFKKGTADYFCDWIFGTRKRRDHFLGFVYSFDVGVEQGDSGQNVENLESTSVMSSTANITFVDERPVDSTSLHTGSETFSRDVHNDIAETDWTMRKVLSREFPIQNFEWKVGSTWSTPIYTNGLPKAITDSTTCMITQQLRFFAFMRAGVHVRVQLNGTKFHCGRLIVYFKPMTWSDDTEDNFNSITCYPHFFLDASVSNSGEIVIPFTHLLSYFSQETKTLFNDSINSLGSLNIRVYNPLQAAEQSSQSLYGQVYLSLMDPYVHLPTKMISNFSYGTGYMQGLESFLKKAAGGAINSGLGLADKFTGGLVTGAGDAICNILGICDKPLDPVSAAPIVNRTVAPLCHGAGLDRSVRLALSPIAQTNTSPSVLGATDGDFNILTLCQMPSLLAQKDWTASQTSGTKLFDMLVTPVYLSEDQYSFDGTGRFANYSPTMLAYVSRGFCLWRGTLKVKIQVIATQFHSGRLVFVHDPHGTHDVNIEDLENNKSHNLIVMDIQEKQELVVDLPNFMVKPWLRCDRFRSNVNLKDGKGVVNASYLDCDAAGVFRVYVLNNLVHPNNVTDKVQVNFFFYAGDNFELTIPNPVAPLTPRKGPSGVQYSNIVRYPWCTSGDAVYCDQTDAILSLYQSGARMFAAGKLTAGANWYSATVKITDQDTLCFVFNCNKLKLYLETATGPCKTLINTLPNYSSGGSSDVIERIDNKTSTIVTDLENIQPTITEIKTISDELHANIQEVDTDVKTIQSRTQDILTNTQRTVTSLNDVNRTLGSMSRQVDQTNSNVNYLSDHTLQDTGCYAYKVRGAAEQQVQWRGLPDATCEPSFAEEGEEQAIESYTTTREDEGASVLITDGNKTSTVAPDTVSENAMVLQTLLRRFYPLVISSDIDHMYNFTIITVPVTPAFSPDDSDRNITSSINRRYTIPNLAWWSRLYTYWRGSMRYKLMINVDDADVYVWHNPTDCKNFHVSSGFSYDHVTEQTNFATEVAVTRVQQGIEVEVPFYSSFNQLLHSHISNKPDLRAQNGTLYIAIRNRKDVMNFSLFVSTGDDFFLNVLRAPPVVHEPKADAYTDSTTAAGNSTQYPEFQCSLGHKSSLVQIPETFAFNRWSSGTFKICDIPAAPQDFRCEELSRQRQQTIPLGVEQGIISKALGVDQVTELGEKLTNQFAKMNSNISEAMTNIPSVLTFLETLRNQIPSVSDTVKRGVDSLQDVATFGKWATDTLMIGTMIVEFADLIRHFSWLRLVKVVIMLCIYMKVEFHSIISWLTQQVQNVYEGYRPKANDGVVGGEQGLTEMIVDNHETVVTTMSAIATVIFCGIFGKLPKWKEITKYVTETICGAEEQSSSLADNLRSIHFSVMGARSINAAYEFFSRWVEKFVNWLIGKECKEIELARTFQEKSESVLNWLNKIEELDADEVIFEALTDVEMHNNIYRLVDEGREFTKWTMRDNVPRNISCVIRDSNKRLMDLVKRINANRPGQGFRYAPFVVMLDGKSSIAKTNVMHEFTDMFREELQIPYFNSVYSVPTTAKYLDGYTGNTIVEWDDILQSSEQDALVAEFINWRSNADFKPNMAVAEEKGKIHFLSKVILMTTNNGDININTIRDMEAFRNRINIKFKCRLAEGWTIARVKALTEKDTAYSFMVFDAYFVNEDGSSFELYKENMSYMDARELTRMHFINWDKKQNNLMTTYLTEHGSLKIPRGVQIDLEQQEEQMDNEEEYFGDATDAYSRMCGGFVLTRSNDLSPNEMDEAQLFEYCFEDCDFVEKLAYYERYQALQRIRNSEKLKTLWKSDSYWTIAKRLFQRGIDEITDLARKVYEAYPRLVQALGMIAAFGTGYALFKAVSSLFHSCLCSTVRFFGFRCGECGKWPKLDNVINREWMLSEWERANGDVPYEEEFVQPPTLDNHLIGCEEAYETTVAKAPTKVIRAEMYQPVVKNASPKIMRAEMYEPVVKSPTRVVRAEAKEQGSDDPEAVEMGRNKIHPLLSIIGWQKSELITSLQCLAIGGKVILAPFHFFRKAKTGDLFYFMRGNDKIVVEYVQERLQRIRDKDAALYYVGPQFDSRKSILNCFVQEKDLGRLGKKVSAVLMGTNFKGVLMEKSCKAESNQIIKYQGKDEGATEFVQTGWKYDVNTLVGECGSILIACSKMLPPPAKIVGMHTAGYANSRGGFSIVLTREFVIEALNALESRFGPNVFDAPLPPQVDRDEKRFLEQAGPKPEGAFTYWGTMDARYCPSQPRKTCFRQTPFYQEIVPSFQKPAALQPINGVSPLKKALAKYGELTTPFSARHIKAVHADLLTELSNFESDLPAEPTSLEVAIFGIAGMPYCEKMNMRSSPGWPYQCLPNAKGEAGKAYLFDVDNRKIKDELLIKNLQEREELAKAGHRYPSIWRDCMKDELRPIAKVEEGKTRLFTIAPVDFTILTRKYFFAFEQMFYKNHSKFFSAVGINPESYEWTVAYNRLRTYGNKCCAGDFSRYDGTLMADLMYETGEIIDEWYKLQGEQDEYATLVRRTLIDEMIHTYQLVNNCVYKTHQGNPSGNPLTVIINTIVNAFYMRLVWMEIMSEKNPKWATLDEYHQNVIEEIYGDDNRLVIKDKVIDVFNQVTITECFARHGIVYTDETKSSTLNPYKELEKTSFLRRDYRFDDEVGKEIIMPVIKFDTITEIINWYRDAEEIEEQLQANMRAALGFAFFHGRKFYEDLLPKYQRAMRLHGYSPICVTYDEQLDRFLAMVHGTDGHYENFVELGF